MVRTIDTLTHVTEDTLHALAVEKEIRKTDEVFLLFSLGSQFDHLIKLALEKIGVFCLVADPATVTVTDVQLIKPTGIILSGGPVSVYDSPPPFDSRIFDLRIPVLGICLGFQLWAQHKKMVVTAAPRAEFGTHTLTVHDPYKLLVGCPETMPVLQSHSDFVEPSFSLLTLGSTENTPAAACSAHLWGVQFHPEVPETIYGQKMFENFCFNICGAKDRFPAEAVAQQKIRQLREQIGDKRVLLALSGGSDSSVVAYLLREALQQKPGQIRAVYIKGIDRPDDEAHVHTFFANQPWLELEVVDATNEFLAAVKGITGMAEKRVAMRGVYQGVLERKAVEHEANFIVQGTLYTDVSESGGGYQTGARKAQIKQHHNVELGFNLPEITPLIDQVKDGARNLGRALGVPEELLIRHPFPGPGLLIRIEGEVTPEKLVMAHQADAIYIEELRRWKLYDSVWQAGVTVTQSQHTSTKGDDSGEGCLLVYWAVWSGNGFTARAARLPEEFHEALQRRFGNEIRGVGAVAYRTSHKPYSTIEWG